MARTAQPAPARHTLLQVRSRFVPDSGPQDQGAATQQHLQPFLKCLARLGFSLQHLDTTNKMFVVMVLRKLNVAVADTAGIAWPALRACVYKKR